MSLNIKAQEPFQDIMWGSTTLVKYLTPMVVGWSLNKRNMFRLNQNFKENEIIITKYRFFWQQQLEVKINATFTML